MTKGDQIVAMVRKEPRISLSVVAERVGCHPAYVRTAMHRAGIFRKKHDPDVIYDTSRASELREHDRERLAALADERAATYEREAALCGKHQIMIVPEPQLSRLKAAHWRILAKWVRESPALNIHYRHEGAE